MSHFSANAERAESACVTQWRQHPCCNDAPRAETAVREGIPFVIMMADGEKYTLPARDRTIVGATRVVLMDDNDVPHVLPLLTMTGVSYIRPKDDTAQA